MAGASSLLRADARRRMSWFEEGRKDHGDDSLTACTTTSLSQVSGEGELCHLPCMPTPKGLQEDEGRASKMLHLYAQSLLLFDCRQLNIPIIQKIFLKNNYPL